MKAAISFPEFQLSQESAFFKGPFRSDVACRTISFPNLQSSIIIQIIEEKIVLGRFETDKSELEAPEINVQYMASKIASEDQKLMEVLSPESQLNFYSSNREVLKAAGIDSPESSFSFVSMNSETRQLYLITCSALSLQCHPIHWRILAEEKRLVSVEVDGDSIYLIRENEIDTLNFKLLKTVPTLLYAPDYIGLERYRGNWYGLTPKCLYLLVQDRNTLIESMAFLNRDNYVFTDISSTQSYVLLRYTNAGQNGILVYKYTVQNTGQLQGSGYSGQSKIYSDFAFSSNDFKVSDPSIFEKAFELSNVLIFVGMQEIILLNPSPQISLGPNQSVMTTSINMLNSTTSLKGTSFIAFIPIGENLDKICLLTTRLLGPMAPASTEPSNQAQYSEHNFLNTLEIGSPFVSFEASSESLLLEKKSVDVVVGYNEYPVFKRQRFEIRFEYFHERHNHLLVYIMGASILLLFIILFLCLSTFKRAWARDSGVKMPRTEDATLASPLLIQQTKTGHKMKRTS